MTTTDKIKSIDLRIASLKAKGETMNFRLIRKQERKKRALQG